ncbi:MAG: cytochrome c family protein [Anaerolineales bacterium]|nr:cytochrome c family protein [Anaerolineales bacterium]
MDKEILRQEAHKTLLFFSLLISLSACQGKPASPATPATTQPTPSLANSPFPFVEDKHKTKLSATSNDWFATAATCTPCHQNIKSSTGSEFSPAERWRGTMMANSARDPYFRASLGLELEKSPQYAAEIQEKCATCHTPMARFSAFANGQTIALIGDQSPYNSQHPHHRLALDGVSCTVCHQIPPTGDADFRHSGDLAIDLTTPYGKRPLYGPLPMSRQSVAMMAGASGYEPVESEHIRQSALCATCHELYLNYLQADGSLSADTFPEQTPYSEWLASAYVSQQTCQDCHLTRTEEAIPISNITPQNRYAGVSQHNFFGGNAYMLTLLNNFGSDLGVEADSGHFRDSIDETMSFLQSRTATLEISNPHIENGVLSFDIVISNLSGHKFPTSFPSRRAWLHITVTDAQQKLIFESGGYDQQGLISENDNDLDPTRFEPHYERITSPQEVQIYESILQTVHGEVTTLQLHTASYLKDNRLLPKGFDKIDAPAHVAVVGDALKDNDFLAGGDTLNVQADVSQAEIPLVIRAELLYQTIGYRWATNVLAASNPLAMEFARYWQQTPNLPIPVAWQSIEIPQ